MAMDLLTDSKKLIEFCRDVLGDDEFMSGGKSRVFSPIGVAALIQALPWGGKLRIDCHNYDHVSVTYTPRRPWESRTVDHTELEPVDGQRIQN